MATSTYYNRFVWGKWNYRANFGKTLPNWIVGLEWFKEENITYVKDEGANLNSMTTILKFVVDCEVFGTEDSFQGICLVMHFLKHAIIR